MPYVALKTLLKPDISVKPHLRAIASIVSACAPGRLRSVRQASRRWLRIHALSEMPASAKTLYRWRTEMW
jgi:hypothetical protein